MEDKNYLIKEKLEKKISTYVPEGIYRKEKSYIFVQRFLDMAELSGLFNEVGAEREKYGPITLYTITLEYADQHLAKKVGKCSFCGSMVYEHEKYQVADDKPRHQMCIDAEVKAIEHRMKKLEARS